jgi:hypothetical protein
MSKSENDDDEALRQGYWAMAADREREVEALVWCEELIGDGFPKD